MRIELNEDAIDYFNNEFEKLLLELQVRPKGMERQNNFETDVCVGKAIKESDIIGPVILSSVNEFEDEIAKYFSHNGREIGYQGENYVKYSKLCEKIYKIKEIEKYISVDFIKAKSFEWVRKRYLGELNVQLWVHLRPQCEDAIKSTKILIPLYQIQVENPIEIGFVKIRQITRNDYDIWYERLIVNKTDDEIREMERHFLDERQQHQGFAAAELEITAESKRAGEIAIVETELAIDVLRLYEPALFHPLINSYCCIYGKQIVTSHKYFVTNNDELENICWASLEKNMHINRIDADKLSRMRNYGLEILSDLLKKEKRTNLQKILLNSLQIYSNSALSKNITDRIISILVSLESILLKGSEPIQNTIGERLAFALTDNGQQRIDVVENFKVIYKLRSKYIHHACEITTDNMQDIQKFMHNVWCFYIDLIHKVHMFSSKEELIDSLDKLKFGVK